jgi:AbrB family looped-hinge helix DNA binding protein
MKQLFDSDNNSQFTVELGDRGRLVLPAPVRNYLGLKEGDELILTVSEDAIIQLSSRKHLASKFRGLYKNF